MRESQSPSCHGGGINCEMLAEDRTRARVCSCSFPFYEKKIKEKQKPKKHSPAIHMYVCCRESRDFDWRMMLHGCHPDLAWQPCLAVCRMNFCNFKRVRSTGIVHITTKQPRDITIWIGYIKHTCDFGGRSLGAYGWCKLVVIYLATYPKRTYRQLNPDDLAF